MEVFVDLTAAYDIVWKKGLLVKFLRMVPCKHNGFACRKYVSNQFIFLFLLAYVFSRFFVFFSGNWRKFYKKQ